MKILQVNAVNGVGSTGRTVSELAAGLAKRGHFSRVAYSTGTPAQHGYVIGSMREKCIHALASRLSGRQAYFSRHGTKALLRFIDDERFDVVHLHNLHSNFINLPLLLEHLASRDIATVLTLDDCWHFTGKCCHYTVERCYRWQHGCGSCPRLMSDNPSWFFDATARMWTDKRRLYSAIRRLGVVGVSEWVTNEARRSILKSAAVIERIYNWVDLSVFSPEWTDQDEAVGLPRDDFLILGVASKWSPEKGLDDFVRLSERLGGHKPGLGDPVGGIAGRLRPRVVLVGRLPARTSLPTGITHLGAIEEVRRLAAVYRRADVLLQLSCEETFGKVVAEALACGTPAIAYDSTANPELIGDGCGYVVEPGSLNQVVDRLVDIAASPAETYRESCRDFAERTFDQDALIDSHVAVYEELCAMYGAQARPSGGSL